MKNITYIHEEEHFILNKIMFKTKVLPMILIYEVLAIFFIAYGIYVKQWVLVSIFSFIALFFPIVMYLIIVLRSKRSYKQYKDLYDKSRYEFTFNEDDVVVDLYHKEVKNSHTFNYNELLMVVETKEHILLFIKNNSAYVVSISGFNNFDLTEFRSIVQTKVKKYKVIK